MTDRVSTSDVATALRVRDRSISWGRSFAEFLGLSSLAIAQPILAPFGADAGSFVTARASGLDIVVFALAVVVVPPALIWLVERLIGLFGRTASLWFHRLSIVGLVAIFASKGLRDALGLAPAAVVALAIGVGVVMLVERFETARQFLGFLAFAPLLFLVFFFMTPVNRLLITNNPPAGGELATHGELPPIVMIVLDELPLDSLLDGSGNIDSDAFPGLAALAQDATFARNHTTVAPNTAVAVPSILTGLYPTSQNDLATGGDHPRNLFTLLGGSYAMRAGEHVTHMCPDSYCETPQAKDTDRSPPLVSLFESTARLVKGTLLPFDRRPHGIDPHGIDPGARFRWLDEFPVDEGGMPTLNYLHSMLPHEDWNRLPNGQEHDAPNPPLGMNGLLMRDDPASVQVVRQRHLLQTAYADSLVADTLDTLREDGLYDESLIIVTSDHGVSFRPGEPARPVSDDNKDDIFWTPLLIKAPHQDKPVVIDTPTASIDVLPTIVDLLGVDVDWDFDGQSIFGPPRKDDWSPHVIAWKPDSAVPADDGFVYADGPAGHDEVVESKALDYGPDTDLRFWRWGDFGDLVGEKVDDLEVAADGASTVVLDDPARFDSVDLAAPVLPLFVSGQISGSGPDAVAVSVNGVIGGWFDTSDPTGTDGSTAFHVLVPPQLLQDGANVIDVYRIDDNDGEPVLVPTR